MGGGRIDSLSNSSQWQWKWSERGVCKQGREGVKERVIDKVEDEQLIKE